MLVYSMEVLPNQLFSKPTMCMFAIEHQYKDQVFSIFKKYLNDNSKYIYSMEISTNKHKLTNGEHFHFLYDDIDNQYPLFSKNLKEKFNLVGKACDGVARQYGKVKDIKDIENATIYTLKDGNYFTNIDNTELLDSYYEQSFKKNPAKEIFEEYIEYMNDIIPPMPMECDVDKYYDMFQKQIDEKNSDTFQWKKYIANIYNETTIFYLSNEHKMPSRNQREGLVLNFVAQSKNDKDVKIILLKILYRDLY